MGKGRPTTNYYKEMLAFQNGDYVNWTRSCTELETDCEEFRKGYESSVQALSSSVDQAKTRVTSCKENKVNKLEGTESGTVKSLSEEVAARRKELDGKADRTTYTGLSTSNADLETCIADARAKVEAHKKKKDAESPATFDPIPNLSLTMGNASASFVSARCPSATSATSPSAWTSYSGRTFGRKRRRKSSRRTRSWKRSLMSKF